MKPILSLLLLTFLCQATTAASSKKPSLRGLKAPGSQAITHLEESRLEAGGSSTATTPGTASSVVAKEGDTANGAKDEVDVHETHGHETGGIYAVEEDLPAVEKQEGAKDEVHENRVIGSNQRREEVDVHETHGHEINGIYVAEQDLSTAVKKQEEGSKDEVENSHRDIFGENQRRKEVDGHPVKEQERAKDAADNSHHDLLGDNQ